MLKRKEPMTLTDPAALSPNAKKQKRSPLSSINLNLAPLEQAQAPLLKKKKKRKKNPDKTFHPKAPSRKGGSHSNTSTLAMRIAMGKKIQSKMSTSPIKPIKSIIKTSATLDLHALNFDESKATLFAQEYEKNIQKIPGFRPIVPTEFSDRGSPIKGETPGKTILKRTKKYGPIATFSEDAKAITSPLKPFITQLSSSQKEKLFVTSPYKAIKTNHLKAKHEEVFITTELLQQAEQEIRKNGRRTCSQNRVMVKDGLSETKASATQLAQAFELFPEELQWEWLHFVAHKFLAHKSQRPNNMGCGALDANTDMMFVEYQIPKLAAAYPLGFWLKVKSNYVPETELLTTIEYTVTTDHFNISFIFNAQTKIPPEITNLDYVGALVVTHLKLADGKIITSPQKPGEAKKEELPRFFTPTLKGMEGSDFTDVQKTLIF